MPVKRTTAILVPAALLAVAAWSAASPTADAARHRPSRASSATAEPSPSGTSTATAQPSPSGTATATAQPSAPSTTAAPTGPTVYVADYGTSADAVQRAMNATPGGATLVFPSGVVYDVTRPLDLPSGVTVVGNQSVLRTSDRSTTSDSDDAIVNTTGSDKLSGLVFDGNIQNQGGVWTQHRHAIRVIGGSSVSVSGNTFRNLISDGVYVGGGASGVDIGHNTFSGDHTNRNGVSIVSAGDVDVHDNVFNSMTRPDMPGAVDLEPNFSSESLRNVQVHGNTVNDPGKYGLLLWNTAGAGITGVAFHDNTVNGGPGGINGGAGILIGHGPAGVYSNTIKNVPKFNGIELDNGASVTVSGNTVDGAYVGINNWQACLSQSGNTFRNIADKDISTAAPTC